MDRRRGDVGRSAWLRQLAVAAINPEGSEPLRDEPRSRHEVARAALSSALTDDPVPEPEGKCSHRAEQIEDGVCECGFDDFAA